MSLLQKFFGSNEKQIKRLQPIVEEINALEGEMTALTDADMIARTRTLQERAQSGTSLKNSCRRRLHSRARRRNVLLDSDTTTCS